MIEVSPYIKVSPDPSHDRVIKTDAVQEITHFDWIYFWAIKLSQGLEQTNNVKLMGLDAITVLFNYSRKIGTRRGCSCLRLI